MKNQMYIFVFKTQRFLRATYVTITVLSLAIVLLFKMNYLMVVGSGLVFCTVLNCFYSVVVNRFINQARLGYIDPVLYAACMGQ